MSETTLLTEQKAGPANDVGGTAGEAEAVRPPGRLSRWLLRGFLWLITRTLYRVRVVGGANIPGHGGALLVCNHLSFVDALLLVASTGRQIRFVMYKGIYELAG